MAAVNQAKRQLSSVRTEDTIDWAPDAADPDADTSALIALFPRDSFGRALVETGFSEVTVKASFINQPVNLKMRLGRLPHYSTARDVRVAIQRAMKSSGFAVAREGFLLRLHTGRITAKFRIAKRRTS